jgi:hypothetical protein
MFGCHTYLVEPPSPPRQSVFAAVGELHGQKGQLKKERDIIQNKISLKKDLKKSPICLQTFSAKNIASPTTSFA